MFWPYIFPFSFAFPPVPLVLHLLLFFLATGIRVFSSFSELDHGYCSFEKGSTVPLLCTSCRRRNSVKGCSNTASSPSFLHSASSFFISASLFLPPSPLFSSSRFASLSRLVLLLYFPVFFLSLLSLTLLLSPFCAVLVRL
ncbi:hypothetical protein NC653_002464 [Populus alba x Populus x berolinensis]|uniref:Transmembrane protein n=1 Tax=Populus alba x Populus x berolinensis TaxID=444605 RepID=A0AAD6RP04_9ROSI|nr:hypothetical protein NC653_002464 [Populus alba x Populus x berolinensis]